MAHKGRRLRSMDGQRRGNGAAVGCCTRVLPVLLCAATDLRLEEVHRVEHLRVDVEGAGEEKVRDDAGADKGGGVGVRHEKAIEAAERVSYAAALRREVAASARSAAGSRRAQDVRPNLSARIPPSSGHSRPSARPLGCSSALHPAAGVISEDADGPQLTHLRHSAHLCKQPHHDSNTQNSPDRYEHLRRLDVRWNGHSIHCFSMISVADIGHFQEGKEAPKRL